MQQGHIIKLRWVDTNKGDNEVPKVRSMLAGKEHRTTDDPENFDHTPPVEALRLVVSRAATVGNEHFGIMVNDVSRAYFNAKIDRLLYCELPDEDQEPGRYLVGRIELCLYGVRGSAKGWQNCMAGNLVDLQCRRDTAHGCAFVHDERGTLTLVHGTVV